MCLAIPMELNERDEYEGIVELGGVQRRVSLLLFPEATPGDHLLIHAGFAIGRVDAEEARLTIEGLERLASEARPS